MIPSEIQLFGFNFFQEFDSRIECSRFFFACFRSVPSIKILKEIDAKRFENWLIKQLEVPILKKHTLQVIKKGIKRPEQLDAIYLLEKELMICLEADEVKILYNESCEQKATELANRFKRFFKKPKKLKEIYLIKNGLLGPKTVPLKIRKPVLDINKNYNDDLTRIHKIVLKSLTQKSKSGLILLHGLPGTGKSTYIRFLIHQLKKKTILISPHLAGSLGNLNLSSLLMDNPNTVFIIEDAEELLLSRETGKNSQISMLLNLTDGLLGEGLGIQVIASFNTHIANIDQALLRKGRLIALYEFKPLAVEKSRILLRDNGLKDIQVNEPMSLADIYNYGDDSCPIDARRRPPIGFAIPSAQLR